VGPDEWLIELRNLPIFFKFAIFQISRFSDFPSNFQHSNT
jgi:hypothetical protein